MAIYFRTFYMAKCTNIVNTFLVIYISAQSNVNISLTHAGRGGLRKEENKNSIFALFSSLWKYL